MREQVSVIYGLLRVFVKTDRVCEFSYLKAQMSRVVADTHLVPDPLYRNATEAPLVSVRRFKSVRRYESFTEITQVTGGWTVDFDSHEDANAFARDWQAVVTRREASTASLGGVNASPRTSIVAKELAAA